MPSQRFRVTCAAHDRVYMFLLRSKSGFVARFDVTSDSLLQSIVERHLVAVGLTTITEPSRGERLVLGLPAGLLSPRLVYDIQRLQELVQDFFAAGQVPDLAAWQFPKIALEIR